MNSGTACRVSDVESGMRSTVAIAALLTLTLVACGDNTESGSTPTATDPAPTTDGGTKPEPVSGEPVVVFEGVGGCQMMGPNCVKYFIYADGSVELYRGGENAPAEITGKIDKAKVDEFLAAVAAEDIDALIKRLPAGECLACLDGIDQIVDVMIDGKYERFESTVVKFVPEEPFFAALESLIAEAGTVGVLEVRQR